VASRILGINLTRTSDGIPLDDGAAVLCEDGVPTVAIAEERLTRRKHAGGIGNAARYCLRARGLSLDDIDHVAISTCCDTACQPSFALAMLESEGLYVRAEQIYPIFSHHLSHAASAYYPSGFGESLVVVADNEGNIIGERMRKSYWHNSLERTTVYLASGDDFRVLRRYGSQPGQLSLGAAYNHFTKWLGFGSYHDAGKVMALAAYGKGRFQGVKVFSGHNLTCLLASPDMALADDEAEVHGAPDDFDREAARFLQAESVRKLILSQAGVDIGPGRSVCAEPDDMQQEIAWLIQSQLEQALVEIVRRALAETGVRRVCLAGGVALNCVANTVVAKMPEVEELFIQPAASDVGQALGNALWAYHHEQQRPRRWVMNSCSLGRTYTRSEVDAAVSAWREEIIVDEPGDIASVAAWLVAGGSIIGWFDGGSEYGLRGLGRRSVLGDPRTLDTKVRLDTAVKRRETFRPYAPSVLEDHLASWFEIDDSFARAAHQPMAFMFVAPRIREERKCEVPAVSFIDGTARLQAVQRTENPRYYDMIQRFYGLTGIPMVLNTSFNAGGDPVVESPYDAIASMFKMRLDALVLGDLLIRSRHAPRSRISSSARLGSGLTRVFTPVPSL
jgi:carbamoyltransferase